MDYEQFSNQMAEKFPRYFGEDQRYGGFAIGEGWYPIIEALVGQIDHYTKWRRRMRAYDLRESRAMNKGLDALIQFKAGKDKTPTDWDIERAEDAMAIGVKNKSKRSLVDCDSIIKVVMTRFLAW